MSEGDNSQGRNLGEPYTFLFGGWLAEQLAEGVNVNPIWSLETSPEIEVTAAHNMYPDRTKILKQVCTAAKSKLTVIKKTVLNTLVSTRTPQSKVDSSERDFQNAFAALNEAHGSYMAAKEDEGDDPDPRGSDYMEGPLADQVEVGEKWTEWHMAKDEIQQAAISADMAKQRQEERDHAKDVEERKGPPISMMPTRRQRRQKKTKLSLW